MNDGYEPTGSRDKSHGVWHNWLGNQSGDAWTEYDWDSEVTIYETSAYYFTDGNFEPKKVTYQYKNANGDWCDLPNAQGCGIALNQYNVTTFDPVQTTALRMNMSPKTLGCGVIEWKVYGYADNVIEKGKLSKLIDQAKKLDLNMFTLSKEETNSFMDLIKEAETIRDKKDVTQDMVDNIAQKLTDSMIELPVK